MRSRRELRSEKFLVAAEVNLVYGVRVAVLRNLSQIPPRAHAFISFPTRRVSCVAEARAQVDHAHDHGTARIERQLLKTPAAIKPAHAIVKRMRDDARAADNTGRMQRRPQREQQQRPRMPLPLKFLVHCQLSKKRHRHRIGAVALLRFRQSMPVQSARRSRSRNRQSGCPPPPAAPSHAKLR